MLHDLMSEWGFGNSLRACNTKQLNAILRNVQNLSRKNLNEGENHDEN